MKFIKTSLLAMALLCLVTSCQKEERTLVTEELNYSIDLNLSQETDWRLANDILQLVNEHRESINLAPITADQSYASAYAVDHTQYMIEISQINHDNFGVRSGALKERGAVVVSENVAYGYQDAQAVVNAWLNSPSHRNNIEGPYSHSGFGVIPNEDGTYYFTQLFYKK